MLVVLFICGLLIGSFLNVCIYRLSQRLSLTNPIFSFCPTCKHRLYPVDLVPLLSYCFLRGKCRYCGAKISPRYAGVELLSGILFVLAYYHDRSLTVLPLLLFFSSLLVLFFIDLDQQIIPDRLNLFTGIAGVILCFLTGYQTFTAMLAGFLTGFGLLYLLCVLSRGGIGGGDIKLAGVMGIFLGWQLTLLALFTGFFLGGMVGIFLLLLQRKKGRDLVPFGPFLAFGSVVSIIWGEQLIHWYLKFLF